MRDAARRMRDACAGFRVSAICDARLAIRGGAALRRAAAALGCRPLLHSKLILGYSPFVRVGRRRPRAGCSRCAASG